MIVYLIGFFIAGSTVLSLNPENSIPQKPEKSVSRERFDLPKGGMRDF